MDLFLLSETVSECPNNYRNSFLQEMKCCFSTIQNYIHVNYLPPPKPWAYKQYHRSHLQWSYSYSNCEMLCWSTAFNQIFRHSLINSYRKAHMTEEGHQFLQNVSFDYYKIASHW